MTSPAATIRVLLCDDHVVVREGLARLLENAPGIEVVAVASDGLEGLEQARETRPDVILMDLSMPLLDGVGATRAIIAELPETYIVVLTSFADRERVLDAIDAGAAGYVLKDSDGDEVVRAIRAAAAGDSPLDPRAARAVLTRRSRETPTTSLTPREREVLALVGGGLSNKVIAIRLGISEATVKAHLTRIYQQIGVTDRTQAALWAREHRAV
jgi:DNA-binding NarL/FixJ family response regulator